MKSLKPTVVALILTMILSSTAMAGNIGGLRTSGNIGGTRTAGNIGGTRTAGNIGGTRTTNVSAPIAAPPAATRFDFEATISATFAGLFRLWLESAALI